MNIAIVTGASSGMGREFVLQLSQYVQVDEIWAIARREAALKSLESAVPVRPVVLDLCQDEAFVIYENLLKTENTDNIFHFACAILQNDPKWRDR